MRPIVCVSVTFMDAIVSDDSFRVRAESLPRNAGEWGAWSVRRVADVCHCAGWLADSLADSEQAGVLSGCQSFPRRRAIPGGDAAAGLDRGWGIVSGRGAAGVQIDVCLDC